MRRIAFCALVALAFPAVASAHATLRSTTPSFRSELKQGPPVIRLRFDQQVKVLPGSVRVLNGVGKDFAGPARATGTDVVASVRHLKLGAYTVRWQAISADSHVVSGVWTFGVGVPAPAVENAYGAGGPTTKEHVVRWIWFLGLALTIGALGLRLIVLRGLRVPQQLERRIAVAAGLGAFATIHAGIIAFSLRAEDALQLPFGRFLYGDLSPMAKTRFGYAFVTMTLVFALVLALVYVSWLLDRVEPLVPALVLAVVFAGGLSLSGHDAVDRGSSWNRGRGLAASLRGVALDRRARDDGALALDGGAGAAQGGLHALLPPRHGADRGRPRRGRVPRDRPPAARERPVDERLRARAAREDRARLVRAPLGRIPPLRRGAGARTRRHRLPRADRPQPGRGEHGRHGRAPARRDPRRLETADLTNPQRRRRIA
jgi:methionine-rich copper-binding protein CopC